jgi:hypothetical protein
MKALSIKQPWASLIANGIKDIENRTWRTNFRGKIYIHASADLKLLKKTGNELYTKEQWLKIPSKMISVSSAIIGEVDIIDCVINHSSIWAEQSLIRPDVIDDKYYNNPFLDNCSFNQKLYNKDLALFENTKPIYNWVLANAKLYDKPILNVKGKLSFWYPDTDIVECIGCSQKFYSETMYEDDGGEKYCPECWEHFAPILAQEAKEIRESEI